MSKNIVKPKSMSFEDALRNLASRLTGRPAAALPRTQEGIVQFMAENVPTLDEMAEAVSQEVMARLEVSKPGEAVTQEVMAWLANNMGEAIAATEASIAAAEEAQSGAEDSGASTPPASETPQEPTEEAAEGTSKPKSTRKTKAKTDN